MQMMYEIIAKELKSMNMENVHPQDYLNFYCLGNREEPPKESSTDEAANGGDGVSIRAATSKPFDLDSQFLTFCTS